MFTGLIKDVGVVGASTSRAGGLDLEIETDLACGISVGDSLAIDGICLTVTAIGGKRVSVTAVPETVKRTVLADYRIGTRCNLEPALCAGDPLGGHFVQGHVDGVGRVRAIDRVGVGWEVSIEMPADLSRYTVEKGSVAINGISLTVARANNNCIVVAVIPHTWQHTTFGSLAPGAKVNLEVDILAKYVEKSTAPFAGSSQGRISEAWLKEHGYA